MEVTEKHVDDNFKIWNETNTVSKNLDTSQENLNVVYKKLFLASEKIGFEADTGFKRKGETIFI